MVYVHSFTLGHVCITWMNVGPCAPPVGGEWGDRAPRSSHQALRILSKHVRTFWGQKGCRTVKTDGGGRLTGLGPAENQASRESLCSQENLVTKLPSLDSAEAPASHR